MRLLLVLMVICFPVLNMFSPHSSNLKINEEKDSSLIIFTGETQKVQFENNRKINSAPFFIINNSDKEIKVIFKKATLLRGNSEDELEKARVSVHMQGQSRKCTEFTIKAKSKKNFSISFKGFTIYAGSQYTVKAYISIDGVDFEAISPLEIYKLKIQDKNKYKPGK